MTYTTMRGVKTKQRPMGNLKEHERIDILREYLAMGSKYTRVRWNISSRTLHHIRWHYRDIERMLEDENFKRRGL